MDNDIGYLKIEELTESYFKLTAKEKWAFQTVIGVKKRLKEIGQQLMN